MIPIWNITLYQNPNIPLAGRLVAEGDSLTNGYPDQTSWPTIFAANNSGVTVFNVSVGGESMANILDQGSEVDPKFNGINSNIIVLWAGTNDMTDSGFSAADTHSFMEMWCNARKAAHPTWIIAVLNCVARSGLNEGTRLSFNALLNSSHSFCDILIDVSAVVETWATKPTYWQADHIHLTTAAYTVIADIIKTKLQEFIN